MKKSRVFFIVFLFVGIPQPLYSGSPEVNIPQAQKALLYSNAETIENFKKATGRYPATLDELAPPLYHLNLDANSKKPYYKVSSDGRSFELSFSGPDGKDLTADDIRYDPSKRANFLLPMFGGPEAVKTPYELEADETFIRSATQMVGGRGQASKELVRIAHQYLAKGESDTAMKRFNQAWLMDQKNPDVYLGFSEILRKQGKSTEANEMLKRAEQLKKK